MMFVKPKENRKCLVFTREEDSSSERYMQYVYTGQNVAAVKTGSIFVKSYLQNLNADKDAKEKPLDLMLRYENVHENLHNLFADFSDQCTKNLMLLYVGGYLDNKVRIFELNRKTNGPCHTLNNHNARVTCVKFSKDYKFLFTCDADGVIHHYQRNCHRGECADMTFDAPDD